MAEVKLENVSKIYDGNVVAVNEVTFTVDDREFVVLVGPSGCGKSTALRMIAGLEEISKGTISIDARIINDVPPKDRDIAMVFQNYALYPHLTVFDNLAFGLKIRKYSKQEIRQRVQEAAAILGLEELLERKPKALSGGQRQRVALGRAMVRRPKVFLFDEPLSNLDANLRVQMRTEISRLHRQLETTMIYVTHDQIEAMSMGDRIVVLKDGVVHQVDTPLNIYGRPADKFVAGFIGSPTVNFIEGRLANGDRLTFVSTIGDVRFALHPKDRPRLISSTNKDLTVGIRPEHIAAKRESEDHQAVGVYVDVIEPVGNEIFVHFTLPPSPVRYVCRMPAGTHLPVGAKHELFFDISKLHFFSRETDKAL